MRIFRYLLLVFMACTLIGATASAQVSKQKVFVDDGTGLFSIIRSLAVGSGSNTLWLPKADGKTFIVFDGTSFSAGDLLYGATTGDGFLTKLPGNISTTRKFLTQTGDGSVSAAPAWGTITQSDISGLTSSSSPTFASLTLSSPLAVNQGGTGQTSLTLHSIQVGNGTSPVTQLAVGATGTVLTGVTGSDPAFSATPTLGVASTTTGQLSLANAASSFVTTIKAGNATAAVTYTLPTADGSSNQVLETDGSGNLSWATVSGGGGGSYVNYAVTSTQATTPITSNKYLFDVAYSNAVVDANVLGGRITSTNTSAGSNLNATGLTVNAAAATGGTATALTLSSTGGTTNRDITGTSGNWYITAAGALTLGTPLTVPNGGTGAGSFTQYGVIYGNGTSALGVTGTGSTGQLLQSNGSGSAPTYTTATYPATTTANQLLYSSATNTVSGLTAGSQYNLLVAAASGVPSWGTINLASSSAVGTSILPVANGGTNADGTSYITNGSFYWNGTRYVTTAASGGAGAFLQTTSSGGAPTFKTVLAEANGGTNQSTYTTGDMLYASATNTLSKLGIGSNGQMLMTGSGVPMWSTATYPATTTANQLLYSSATNTVSGLTAGSQYNVLVAGASGVPSWGTINLASSSAVGTSILPVGNGGSGQSSLTLHSIQVGNGTSAVTQLGVGASGTVLTGVSSSDPAFSATPTLGVASSTTGQLSFANASSANLTTIQAGNATSAVTYTLPTADGSSNQVLQTDGSGNLSWATVSGGGGSYVNYAVTSQQASTPITSSKYLYDVAYSSSVVDANVLGARITSTNTSTGSNHNATGLTLTATATSGGTATALSLSSSGGTTNRDITGTSGNWYITSAGALTLGTPLAVASGGTNADGTSYITNGSFYWNGTRYVTTAASGGAGAFLQTTSSGGAPTFKTVLAEANGGTNQSTYTTGDMLYASASNTLSKLGIGSNGQMLMTGSGVPMWSTATYPATTTANQLLYSSATNTVSGLTAGSQYNLLVAGASGVPSWGTINLASSSAVGTSILPVANGGTNADGSSYITNGSFYWDGTRYVTSAASGGAGAFLQTTTSGGAPTFKTVLAEANGGTNQSSYTKGDVLYASAANTLNKLPIGAAGAILTVNASGVPAWTGTAGATAAAYDTGVAAYAGTGTITSSGTPSTTVTGTSTTFTSQLHVGDVIASKSASGVMQKHAVSTLTSNTSMTTDSGWASGLSSNGFYVIPAALTANGVNATGGAIVGPDGSSVSSSGTTVTGSSTTFLKDSVGDILVAAGQRRMITSIASNTSLTTDLAFNPALSASTPYRIEPAYAASRLQISADYSTRMSTLILTTPSSGTTYDNVQIGNNSNVRLTGPTGPFTLAGIGGGLPGKRLHLQNATGQNMTIANHGSGTPGYSIVTLSGGDITNVSNGSIELIFDADSGAWLINSIQSFATQGEIGTPQILQQGTDTTYTTGLVSSSKFYWSVSPSSTWEVDGILFFVGNASGSDLDIALTIPGTSPTLGLAVQGLNIGTAASNGIGTQTLTVNSTAIGSALTCGTTESFAYVHGIFKTGTGTSSNNAVFKFAEHTSGHTVTLHGSSYLKVMRIN